MNATLLPHKTSMDRAATPAETAFELLPDTKRPRGPETVPSAAGGARYLGLDLGAESIKVSELTRVAGGWCWTRRRRVEHAKDPGACLEALLDEFGYDTAAGATVTGRLGRQVNLARIPLKEAQARGYRFLYGQTPATLVSIGSHGFSVLELRPSGGEVFRENSRCSQGTGNFLRQLTERFGLTVEAASELAATVTAPAPLSGRCPVILKTDMTHLANKGEDRARILAGLFDAVGANVLALLKPGISPTRVLLLGGVCQAPRLRHQFAEYLESRGMTLISPPEDQGFFFEALGCALLAAEKATPPPPRRQLWLPAAELKLERLPSLREALGQVRRLKPPPPARATEPAAPLILGLDIGSTGSKIVALDAAQETVVWESYRRTAGDPIGASQALWREFTASSAGARPVQAVGVTGSGREIVGSLLIACYRPEAVFVLNEIVAHAEGALHYDRRVDTIFEIGGQDAKYIRLGGGRVIDCAMNEACSAGTGSFIEEQGGKFPGAPGVVELGQAALAAPGGVSLGQHCSVFMAEIIDEAVAVGLPTGTIIAGLYDSIIRNYLNRVKGSRPVGQVVFCQGMPFTADALAAAVARQTGSQVVIPPSPGSVGALGIALLARRQTPWPAATPLRPERFLDACVESKEVFVCKATVGCGGAGNRCRIDSLKTVVNGRRLGFRWGGACALYDQGARRQKLPPRAPDPFAEREEQVRALVRGLSAPHPRQVAITDEFALKGLFPFFATYLHRLGLGLRFVTGGDQAMLKRGIQEANVPFCAPLQLYQGLVSGLAETGADFLFLPMLRSLPRAGEEPHAKTCPLVQASPELIGWCLDRPKRARILSPVFDLGPGNLDSACFQAACQRLAQAVGIENGEWRPAYAAACAAQVRFERGCEAIGQRALAFGQEHALATVVVVGRPYTIHNRVLNSNVPALLREQGALAIPLDCYPVAAATPLFHDMYWAYGQRILRAAHQIRRAPRLYSLYCSNYSCGPDSFNLHFYSYLMEGKPFAIVETDGHSGDAGTKTRVEAFLHCVREDLRAAGAARPPHQFPGLARAAVSLEEVRQRDDYVLVPRLGVASAPVAACLRGLGVRAECLPLADSEALRLGRRYTSGKECLPMCVTLGTLLQRVQAEPDPRARFLFIMPRAPGPCRFGVYNLLTQIVLERLGLADRVRLWSMEESNYFDSFSSGFTTLLIAGFSAADLLLEGLLAARPLERQAGAAQAVYDRYQRALIALLERAAAAEPAVPRVLWQVTSGRLFGLTRLLRRAAHEFAALRTGKELPTVLVVGEIFVRCDPFSNDFVLEKLERRGLRCRLAPFHEWLEYVDYLRHRKGQAQGWAEEVGRRVQERIRALAYQAMAGPLGWPRRTTVPAALAAVGAYVRPELEGEAVLTVGGPLDAWRRNEIDAVVSAGPLECMPNKIAEAQFFHVAEQEGLLSLTLALNGDPVDPVTLDNFAYQVQARFDQRRRRAPLAIPALAAGVAK